MQSIQRIACAAFALCAAALASAAQPGPFYRIESAQTIKSPTTPNWDYLAFDEAHGTLYIARRDDGILVYDAKARKLRGSIPGTQGGGNAVILAAEFNRGFALNQDGSAVVFDLATRKPLQTVKFGDDADYGTYDPVTKQVMVTRGDSHQVTFLDARTGEVKGHVAIDSKKIEGAAPDGHGNILVALRDRNKVLRIDARERKVAAEFASTPQCEEPSGLALDTRTQRAFVGCRGKAPVLAVMDAADGRIVSTTPIGRGNDVVLYDDAAHRIYASNGVDANMVVIDQLDADTYKAAEATTTRPNARTMALDTKSKTVYLVSAEGTVAAGKVTWFKDTFTLLTLTRR